MSSKITNLITWFWKEDKIATTPDMKEFIQLMEDYYPLEQELYIMYRAISRCGAELYKHTGDVNHLMPEYWIKVIKEEFYNNES